MLLQMYRNHYKLIAEDKGYYAVQHFEVSPVCNSRFTCNNTNMISRIQNVFAKALSKAQHLPSFVVVVLEDDIIKFLGSESKIGISTVYQSTDFG